MNGLRPTHLQSAAWAAGLGALFLLVYGGINAFTATLDEVPSLFLAWERQIPFVSWTVVPYWSLDLFFIASFFLAADREQLRRHGARLAAAILGAGVLFLLVPLRFAWVRPETDGLDGLLFDALSFDRPFNQFPSLHVALALLIWPLIRRRTRGLVRVGLGVWFLLVGFSTLTTWQHHLVDLVGGLAFGLLVGHAIPLDPEPMDEPGRRHRVMAGRYALAAVILTLGALPGGIWTLLLWPALSLALVSTAYGTGRRGFLKATGDGLPISTWLLFWPWLLGMRLNARLRGRRLGGAAELTPGVWFGPHPSVTGEIPRAVHLTLVSLAPELGPTPGEEVETVTIPALDLVTLAPETLREALDAVHLARERGIVYIHCALGLGRSAQVAAAWLEGRGMAPDAARERVRTLRPGALPAFLAGEQSADFCAKLDRLHAES